jgi:hypothetical protein
MIREFSLLPLLGAVSANQMHEPDKRLIISADWRRLADKKLITFMCNPTQTGNPL